MLIFLSCLAGCIERPQPCVKDYAFKFPISVTSRDTFVIGDTIWWEMSISNLITDAKNGEEIDFTNFELFFVFSVGALDSTVPVTGSGVNHLFDFVSPKGKVVQRSNVLEYTYFLTESVENKCFTIGCIPREEGTYVGSLRFPNLYFNADREATDGLYISDSSCREMLTFLSEIEVNNRDINYHMMEGICLYYLDGGRFCYGPESEIPTYSGYAFHVKEP